MVATPGFLINNSFTSCSMRAPRILHHDLTTFFKNSPESFPARLSRILQLCLWMGWSLISCGFMAQPGLLYCYQPRVAQGRHGDNAWEPSRYCNTPYAKAAVPLFTPLCRKSVFPYTNATGSMSCRLVTRFMTRIATTWFAPLTALKVWLRFSMLFTQAQTGEAAHAKTSLAA